MTVLIYSVIFMIWNKRHSSVRCPSKYPSVKCPSVRCPSVRCPSIRRPLIRLPSIRLPSIRWSSSRQPSVQRNDNHASSVNAYSDGYNDHLVLNSSDEESDQDEEKGKATKEFPTTKEAMHNPYQLNEEHFYEDAD